MIELKEKGFNSKNTRERKRQSASKHVVRRGINRKRATSMKARDCRLIYFVCTDLVSDVCIKGASGVDRRKTVYWWRRILEFVLSVFMCFNTALNL